MGQRMMVQKKGTLRALRSLITFEIAFVLQKMTVVRCSKALDLQEITVGSRENRKVLEEKHRSISTPHK